MSTRYKYLGVRNFDTVYIKLNLDIDLEWGEINGLNKLLEMSTLSWDLESIHLIVIDMCEQTTLMIGYIFIIIFILVLETWIIWIW